MRRVSVGDTTTVLCRRPRCDYRGYDSAAAAAAQAQLKVAALHLTLTSHLPSQSLITSVELAAAE